MNTNCGNCEFFDVDKMLGYCRFHEKPVMDSFRCDFWLLGVAFRNGHTEPVGDSAVSEARNTLTADEHDSSTGVTD